MRPFLLAALLALAAETAPAAGLPAQAPVPPQAPPVRGACGCPSYNVCTCGGHGRDCDGRGTCDCGDACRCPPAYRRPPVERVRPPLRAAKPASVYIPSTFAPAVYSLPWVNRSCAGGS